jgi:hypothetical protein
LEQTAQKEETNLEIIDEKVKGTTRLSKRVRIVKSEETVTRKTLTAKRTKTETTRRHK